MKKKNYSISDKLKRDERGKLRYLKRVAEDEEAEQEIDNYIVEDTDDDAYRPIQNTIRT